MRSASRTLSQLLMLTLAVGLSGCSWFNFFGDDDLPKPEKNTIARVIHDLPDIKLPKATVAKPTREEVMLAYERVYGLLPSRNENHAVGKRLADLQMSVGEEHDIEGREDPYGAAVALYESLLLDGAGEGTDEIIYQLARAYDIVGRTDQTIHYLDRLINEYPASRYVVESRFRRAEIEFSRDHYPEAARDYAYVAALGDTTPYWRNASYMLGWSQFKRSNFEVGLLSFFVVISSLLDEQASDELPAAETELLRDTFRVVTLALGYLDGPETLAAQMTELDKPPWQYLAYQTLAADYLEKERFLDSVAAWQMFIDHNGLDPRAPEAHVGMIDTLVKADFPSEIRPKKEQFVERYGIYSEFWSVHEQAVRETYLATLKTYLVELAQIYHGEAQKSQKQFDYLQAAGRYEELLATFPADPAAAEYVFLLGEVYTEADEHARAVAAYQRVVREFGDDKNATEAGYAAILGLANLVTTAPADELELWQRLKIDAQIEFALLFTDDERAPSTQTAAADSLFKLAEYQPAIDLAQNLLLLWPNVDSVLKKTALLILGHGGFELGNFVAAEAAYHELKILGLTADELGKVQERLLAAVYKQGEASEAAGFVDEAVTHYLRLQTLDPNAELAILGHYDAVAAIEQSGRIAEAAELLAEFRLSYPNHVLGRDTTKRLADMYERSENWHLAASEYLTLSKHAEVEEVRRQSLYRAAELYLDLGDTDSAISYFRDYAHTYMTPEDLRMEAMDHLDLLYQKTNEPDKRRFWLRKKIALHQMMGRKANQRATYLAASAQYVFATDERQRFDGVHLTRPLKKSLKRKQSALKRTLKAFEKVAEYKVVEFATAATFHIADLYSALSSEIMNSDRPQDLNELELEQYEILLEEQAFPFEEQAISLHEINMRRSWNGTYDDWVKKSFTELGRLMPARFDKQEIQIAYVEVIH